MSNHFHLLVSTPEANISQAMQYFMTQTSREITRLSGRINQTYGARFHRSLITNYNYYMSAYKYVYRNPVRADICQRVEDYPFSSMHGLLGAKQLFIPLEEDTLLFNRSFDESSLRWLNTSPTGEAESDVRKALRRSVFSYPRAKNNKRNRLEDERL